jgi:hypothetical protein
MMRRRDFITTAIVATAATPAIASEASNSPDPLPQLWEEFQAAHTEHCEASYLPENGNFDTPVMIEIETRKDKLEELLSNTAPQTRQGAAAKLKFIERELGEGIMWGEHLKMLADVIKFLEASA